MNGLPDVMNEYVPLMLVSEPPIVLLPPPTVQLAAQPSQQAALVFVC